MLRYEHYNISQASVFLKHYRVYIINKGGSILIANHKYYDDPNLLALGLFPINLTVAQFLYF
jgi:hypothetical protein